MRMPNRLTPAQLHGELASAGLHVSLRTLRLWRAQGLLPPLSPQPRKGYRRGKGQLWRSPSLVLQAITICQLRGLSYPNDEARLVLWWMGFPVPLQKLRAAWKSRLGKTDALLKRRRQRVRAKASEPFTDAEDEISALLNASVVVSAKQLGIKKGELIQPSIDLFRFVFEPNYSLDDTSLYNLWEIFSQNAKVKIAQDEQLMEDKDFKVLSGFMMRTMTFKAVQNIITRASNSELRSAHRRWRRIIRLAQKSFPELRENKVQIGACRFGRICIPAIIHLVCEGRLPQLDGTLEEVEPFVAQHDLRAMFAAAISRQRIEKNARKDLTALLARLRQIWEYSGFPFSVSK